MKDVFIIKKPWITEKSTRLNEMGKYVFMVQPSATKNEVGKLVEEIYHVHPIRVHIVRRPGKEKRFRNVSGTQGKYKKAIVTLKAGEKIDLGR
ncbi:50S ribosomal protein L23 [Candidatus Parcubacteria bacterium]|nr:MAG: 50S ribosomal protein L23 [Candidatus Parcubacteria bacterium]